MDVFVTSSRCCKTLHLCGCVCDVFKILQNSALVWMCLWPLKILQNSTFLALCGCVFVLKSYKTLHLRGCLCDVLRSCKTLHVRGCLWNMCLSNKKGKVESCLFAIQFGSNEEIYSWTEPVLDEGRQPSGLNMAGWRELSRVRKARSNVSLKIDHLLHSRGKREISRTSVDNEMVF